jgi:manganese/zinc/iron transport system substrate-binding protein
MTSRLRTWFLGAVLGGVAVALAASCSRAPGSGGAGGANPGDAGVKVVCTTGMIADAARAIGGSRVRVTQLMGEGVDPHLYRASPGDMRLIRGAGVVLSNGLHLEGRMGEVLASPGAGVVARAVGEAIPDDRLMRPKEFAGQHDPHVWFDVALWIHAVGAVRDALVEADGSGRGAYEAAAAVYVGELEELDQWCREQLGSIPLERRVLVTAHDAFGYFGRAYNIEVLAIQGVSTDSESGVGDINRLVDLIVARKVPAVFVESSVPRKLVEALVEGCASRGHAVRIGGELFSDAMGAAGTPEGTYQGMVRHNVRTIVEALAPGAGG